MFIGYLDGSLKINNVCFTMIMTKIVTKEKFVDSIFESVEAIGELKFEMRWADYYFKDDCSSTL